MNYTTTFENCIENRELVNNTMFILDQGWHHKIRKCAETGAFIVLPNFDMSEKLLAMTLLQARRANIATTVELWEKVKEVLCGELHLCSNWEVILFKN